MEFFKKVIEDSPNPTYLKDGEGKLVLANKAYADIFGTTVESLLSKGAVDYDFSFQKDLDVLDSGKTLSFDEIYRLKEGDKVWFNTVKKIIQIESGEKFLLSVSSDITELKRAYLLAEEAVKAKGTFLANVSHEIRTPMNGILGMGRLLEKSQLDQDQKKYVKYILSNADSLLEIFNEILDYTNVESGNLKVETVPFDVVAEVDNIVQKTLVKAHYKGLKLILNEPENKLPVVEGDAYLLSQVINHLLNNAIKFTKEGQVVVHIAEESRKSESIQITFCIEDTGIGISSDKFDLVFESFNQAYSSNTRLYGGTGLGLTLSKNIVELLNGKIWLESYPGLGSKFYFTLPFKISNKEAKAVSSLQNYEPQNVKDLNILLAEDNNVSQFLILSYLHPKGIKLEIASNGKEAVAKAQSRKFDLILMDIQMPLMSGISATEKIRKEPNVNQNTPIIAFTANILRSDVETYKKVGFNDFLPKPFHEADLYRIISIYADVPIDGKMEDYQTDSHEKNQLLYNFSGLGSLADDKQFVYEMKELFVNSVPEKILQLEEAVESKNWKEVESISHSLKSTLGNIQINDAHEAVRLLEICAGEGSEIEKMNELILIVKSAVDKIIPLFIQDINNHSKE